MVHNWLLSHRCNNWRDRPMSLLLLLLLLDIVRCRTTAELTVLVYLREYKTICTVLAWDVAVVLLFIVKASFSNQARFLRVKFNRCFCKFKFLELLQILLQCHVCSFELLNLTLLHAILTLQHSILFLE